MPYHAVAQCPSNAPLVHQNQTGHSTELWLESARMLRQLTEANICHHFRACSPRSSSSEAGEQFCEAFNKCHRTHRPRVFASGGASPIVLNGAIALTEY